MAPDNTTDDSNAADGPVEHEDDIDWSAVISATETDWLRRRFAFNSADCATEEKVTTLLHGWIRGRRVSSSWWPSGTCVRRVRPRPRL